MEIGVQSFFLELGVISNFKYYFAFNNQMFIL